MASGKPTKQELIEKIIKAREMVRQTKRELYKKNFYEFSKEVIGWPDIYEPLHKPVCDFIQDNVDKYKLLLLLPRGCFKSSIVTIGYPLWQIAKNPDLRGLIGNATYPMAVKFLSQIKNNLMGNETFRELYGNLDAGSTKWREDSFAVASKETYMSKEATVTAIGVGSNYTGTHYDYAILDDLVNRDNIGTQERIEGVINVYKDVLDLVDPGVTGHKPVIVIGTTWHYADLYSWIQDEENGVIQDFKVMCLPAYKGEWGKGELLFPTRLTWDVLEGLKRQQGSSHFAAQYMLDPVPLENATFKADFKYYDKTDIRGMDMNVFITVDPAISERKEADYSAMTCVGVDKENTWYILDLWRDKVQPKRLIDQIFMWDQKWKPLSIGLETNAFQKMIQYHLNDEMRSRNHFVPIKELKHAKEGSKEERIRGLEPRYEIGTILHPYKTDMPLIVALEDELRRFPVNKNDDLVDSLASQLELTFPRRKRERRLNRSRSRVYPA